MKAGVHDSGEGLGLTVWERDEAFPPAGEGFGWIDRKGGRHSSPSLDNLAKTIREDRDSVVNLVWTPELEYCRVPEEVATFAEPIAEVRVRWATDDLADAAHRMKILGAGLTVLLCYMAVLSWGNAAASSGLSDSDRFAAVLRTLVQSTYVGMGALAFLIFAFIPWYQARKRIAEMKKPAARPAQVIPLIRFETWLEMQKSPVTRLILGLVLAVAAGQIFFDRALFTFGTSVQSAGLVKQAYSGGDWWRLFTAPMMHGGVVHLAMNGMALIYLGKRVEVFARWPHVPMVFLFSAVVGGVASARFTDATSVGASGGLMGWLGFLLVFETLHSKLVPRSAKRRLLGGVLITALIGLIGYRFIDNAAHLGGLVAGMLYAGIVFPKSGSVLRPKANLTDIITGTASMGVISAAGVYSLILIATGSTR